MMDHPAETIDFSPPAHQMPTPSHGLWIVALLLIVVDVVLVTIIAVDDTLSPLLVPVLLMAGIVANMGVAYFIMQSLPDSYHPLAYKLLAAGMLVGALLGLLIGGR